MRIAHGRLVISDDKDDEPSTNSVKQTKETNLSEVKQDHREPYRISTRKMTTNYTEVNSSDDEIFEEALSEDNETDVVVKTELIESAGDSLSGNDSESSSKLNVEASNTEEKSDLAVSTTDQEKQIKTLGIKDNKTGSLEEVGNTIAIIDWTKNRTPSIMYDNPEDVTQLEVRCVLCSKQYSKRCHLQRHMLDKHNIQLKQKNNKSTVLGPTNDVADILLGNEGEAVEQKSDSGERGLLDNEELRSEGPEKVLAVVESNDRSSPMILYDDEDDITRTEIRCVMCSEQFMKRCYLQHHMLRNHKIRLLRKKKDLKVPDSINKKAVIKANENRGSVMEESEAGTEPEDSHEEEPFRRFHCDHCPSKFFQKHHLKRHMLTSHNIEAESKNLKAKLPGLPFPKLFKCDECGDEFKRAYQLLKHKKTHLGGQVTDSVTDTSIEENFERETFMCNVCDMNFGRKCDLHQHQQNIHFTKIENAPETQETNLVESDKNAKEVSTEEVVEENVDSIMLALESAEKLAEKELDIQKPFLCSYCDKRCSKRKYLHQHMSFKHPEYFGQPTYDQIEEPVAKKPKLREIAPKIELNSTPNQGLESSPQSPEKVPEDAATENAKKLIDEESSEQTSPLPSTSEPQPPAKPIVQKSISQNPELAKSPVCKITVNHPFVPIKVTKLAINPLKTVDLNQNLVCDICNEHCDTQETLISHAKLHIIEDLDDQLLMSYVQV